jgi:hypothetical protein
MNATLVLTIVKFVTQQEQHTAILASVKLDIIVMLIINALNVKMDVLPVQLVLHALLVPALLDTL